MPRISSKVKKAIAPVRVATTLAELKASGADAAWRPIQCAGFDLDEQGCKHYHHIEMLPCTCPPGPHIQSLWSTCFETAEGGGRGSGKSVNTYGIALRGNPDRWKTGASADVSYINHPRYTFLIIRKNALDLDWWFREFRQIVEPMGAVCTENPMRVRFPSGAEGSFGHLDDPDVYMKYQGKSFTRIIVEEAGQIAQESTYLKAILGSCRSAVAELHAQIWLTFNPGGPGAKWLNARFRYPHAGNNPWPYARTYKNKYTGRTRVMFHSTVYDNPYFLVNNADYVKTLEMYKETDPTLYAQWLLGDFDITPGCFFPAFRKERRITEPENAVHVIPPRPMAPWWPRAIGVDWGFSHPTGMVRGVWTPDKQLIIDREAMFQGLSCTEVGAEIARVNLPVLDGLPSHHLNCYLSHDCFHRDGRETEADQIARGMNQVLGSGSVFVLSPTQEELDQDPKTAWEAVKRRQNNQATTTVITLIPAGGGAKRRFAYNLIRDYMRWQSLTASAKFDEEYAQQIMMTDGALAYLEYKQSFDRAVAEKLPVLQIFNSCPKLIGQIMATQENPSNTEEPLKQDGDDCIDAAAHLVSSFPAGMDAVPRSVQIQARMDRIGKGWETANLDLMRQYHESKLAPQQGRLTIPRSAGPSVRRRVN